MRRYQRQSALPAVGATGQQRLRAASVLVLGAGGLGCPVLQYLAAAGVGRLLLVDKDVVEETNLHRQPLYSLEDVGRPKVVAAAAALQRLNPDVRCDTLIDWLRPDNAYDLVSQVDVVVDAGDNRAVTYMLDDVCRSLGKPLIAAQALALEGHVGGFCGGQAPCYRSVFPELPENARNCSTGGVLGTVVAIIGSLQAQFVLQYLLNISPSPLGRLLRFDAQQLAFRSWSFQQAKAPQSPYCQFISLGDLAIDDRVIDLRSPQELPPVPFAGTRRLPVDQIEQALDDNVTTRIVLCCQSGLRAWRAAQRLRQRGWTNVALLAMGGEAVSPSSEVNVTKVIQEKEIT